MRHWLIGLLISTCALLPSVALSAQRRLHYGESIDGALSAGQPEARYLFSGREGDAVLITADSTSPEALDPLVMLLDADQRQVFALDDNSGGAVNARLRHILPRNGDYLIKVIASPSSQRTAGAFRLTLHLLNPTPTPSLLSNSPRLAPLDAGASLRAELSDQAPFRLYAVYAVAAQPLSITLSLENALPVGMYLYSHDFERRLVTAELTDQLSFVPNADGWCWLVVSRLTSSGSVAYTLKRAAEPQSQPRRAEGVSLVAGLAQRGALSPRFATLYHFEAQRGSRADLVLQAQTALPALIVLADERFEQVAVGEGALRAVELERSGRYYVIVARYGGVNDTLSGEYTLTLSGTLTPLVTPSPLPLTISTINSGEVLRGVLDDQRYIAYYTFTGRRGESAQITLNVESGTLQPALYLYVYQGDQPRLLASAAELRSAQIQLTLPESATYLIVVTRYGAAHGITQGRYAVQLILAE
ncbi:MAG: hypothetical protein NZ571_01935 [Anaerolineae bacterium]|nr:hypothetical protein [Anaerolineae bacterium]